MCPVDAVADRSVQQNKAGCRSKTGLKKKRLFFWHWDSAVYEKLKSSGVFELYPLADRSIQLDTNWFVCIIALHRWVAVQSSWFLSFPDFSSGVFLDGRGMIRQSPQWNNHSSDRVCMCLCGYVCQCVQVSPPASRDLKKVVSKGCDGGRYCFRVRW